MTEHTACKSLEGVWDTSSLCRKVTRLRLPFFITLRTPTNFLATAFKLPMRTGAAAHVPRSSTFPALIRSIPFHLQTTMLTESVDHSLRHGTLALTETDTYRSLYTTVFGLPRTPVHPELSALGPGLEIITTLRSILLMMYKSFSQGSN